MRGAHHHIVSFDGTSRHGQAPYAVLCTLCGVAFVPTLPMPTMEFLRQVSAFAFATGHACVRALDSVLLALAAAALGWALAFTWGPMACGAVRP